MITIETLNGLKVGQTVRNNLYMVRRQNRSTFRLGEIGGDWMMSGTSSEVAARALRTVAFSQN